jgi:uncharacterized protein (TIGR02646 family)
MIRVKRTPASLPVLAIEGTTKAQEHCDAYSNGIREFQFDSTIYGHDSVKEALVAMHHGKCCYCESRVRHTGPGTIDHYRPKAASQQRVGNPFFRPGYYWLAYHWHNLLFECVACNQTYKRNLFPLQDETRRALSHLHPVGEEEPVLINPSRENPEDFVSFHEEYAFEVNGNHRGRVTIEILGLNDRTDLVEQRRDKIRVLRILRKIVRLLPQDSDGLAAQQYLDEAVLDTAEYAAMARSFLLHT